MRLFLLLAVILALCWLFLAWVFGRRGANLIILLLGGVGLLVVPGVMLHFNPAWILFAVWTLFAVVVGLSSADRRPLWQTVLAILALVGLGGVGIVGSALGYSVTQIALGEGLVLLAVIVVGAVMGFLGQG